MKTSLTKRIHNNYFNLNRSTAFTSVKRVASASKAKIGDVQEYLRDQPSYTLFKKVRRKFERRKTIGIAPGQTLQADLADFQLWKRDNDGYNYCLIAIDCYSRYVFALPVRQKTSTEMRRVMSQIFDQGKARFGHVCSRLVTDQGREFYNKETGALYKSLNINHFSPKSEMKAAMAERAIQTFKKRLYKYLHYKSSRRWIDSVDAIVRSINKTPNRSIGMAPEKVRDGDVDEGVSTIEISPSKLPIQVGDSVRISKTKHTFEKGYTPNWTEEIFIVDKVKSLSKPPYLKLKDLSGDTVDGSFYLEEVQKVIDTGMYKVERILKRRKFRGENQLFVRWLGYPPSFDSWIDADTVVTI